MVPMFARTGLVDHKVHHHSQYDLHIVMKEFMLTILVSFLFTPIPFIAPDILSLKVQSRK